MKGLFKTILLAVAASVSIGVGIAVAQPNGGNGIAATKPAAASLPFAAGETLTYEGKLNKIIRGISVAELTFTVGETTDGNDFIINAEARSKGTLLKLFRFSFLQKIDTTIERDGFYAQKTVKLDVQKDRVRNSEALFDYTERRVTYVETDPKEPMRPPRRIASDLESEAHDLVSAIYSLRVRPMKVGDAFMVPVSDSGLVYYVPVRVTAREKQKTIFGNVWCFKVEPQVFGPERMIEREGSMEIWITDDARRIPVRSRVKSNFGTIEIRLREAANTLPVKAERASK
ncbi:MAG: DUF3108 domain-containing protein [Acidobacteria bacterium]|nr:DUF3108 domain-containing protein [Acidobacteriota bacterium]